MVSPQSTIVHTRMARALSEWSSRYDTPVINDEMYSLGDIPNCF